MSKFFKSTNYPIVKILIAISLILLFLTNGASILESSYSEHFDNDTSSSLLETHDPISVRSNQDFIDQGFAGTGSEENPYIIENYEISSSSETPAILIENTTKSFIIRGCSISSGSAGISIIKTGSGVVQIINNTCTKNRINAIWIESVKTGILSGNVFSENYNGIRAESCSNLLITRNICNFNQGSGMSIFNCVSLNVTENKCIQNNHWGVVFDNISESVFLQNSIENSFLYGLLLTIQSKNNIIHHNDFIDNIPSVEFSQGRDEGSNNTWYDEKKQEGNYWNDHSGKGSYKVDGPALSYDLYPLKKSFSVTADYPVLSLISLLIPIFYYISGRKRKKV